MPRTPEVIQAEIDAAKAKNVHPRSAQMRVLHDELKAAQTPDGASSPEPETETVGAEESVSVSVSLGDAGEMAFIEKACAEVELQAGGVQTGAMKKFYNALWAKVQVRRIALDIVAQVGIGGEWPQWVALNRDESTGKKIEPKPIARVVAPDPAPAAAPGVSAGGMPVRSARPSAADILASVTGGDPRSGLKQDIASRPEPQRTPETATA